MQTPMTACHLMPTWHKWNVNANDIMMTWFALCVNLVMSHLPCMMHMCMHGACALHETSTSKQLNCLVHTSWLELSENTCLTFLGTKYPKRSPDHAKVDSHFISQQELH